MKDEDVPWEHALKIVPVFDCDDVETILVKAGDHRLSNEDDLARLGNVLSDVTLKSS